MLGFRPPPGENQPWVPVFCLIACAGRFLIAVAAACCMRWLNSVAFGWCDVAWSDGVLGDGLTISLWGPFHALWFWWWLLPSGFPAPFFQGHSLILLRSVLWLRGELNPSLGDSFPYFLLSVALYGTNWGAWQPILYTTWRSCLFSFNVWRSSVGLSALVLG